MRYTACLDVERQTRQTVTTAEKRRDDISMCHWNLSCTFSKWMMKVGVLLARSQHPAGGLSEDLSLRYLTSLMSFLYCRFHKRLAIQKLLPLWGWTRKPLAVSRRSKHLSHELDFRHHLPSSRTTDRTSLIHADNLNLWIHGQNRIQIKECIPPVMWQTISRCGELFFGHLLWLWRPPCW